MRAADRAWLALVALTAALGLALKLFVGDRYEDQDVPAANRIVYHRLSEAGFSIDPPRFAGDWRLVGRRADCLVFAGVTDNMGLNFAMWQRAARGGSLRYHYRGASSGEFPRWRGPIDAQVQMLLDRMGIRTPRAAIVATIERGRCAGMLPDLGRITMPMQRVTRMLQ